MLTNPLRSAIDAVAAGRERESEYGVALQRRAGRFVTVACIGAMALGLLVILGWAFRLKGLRSPDLGEARRILWSAIWLVGGGLALWLQRAPAAAARSGGMLGGQWLAAAVTLSALIVLAGVGLDSGFGFGRFGLPFLSGAGAASFGPWGGASWLGPSVFFLLGLALLLLDRPPTYGFRLLAPAQYVAIVGLTLVVTDSLQLLFPAPGLTPHLTLPLSVGVQLLFCALIAARPAWGVGALLTQPNLGGWLVRRMLLPAIFFPLFIKAIAWWAFANGWISRWYEAAAVVIAITFCLSASVLICAHIVAKIELERQKSMALLGQKVTELGEAERIAGVGSWRWDASSKTMIWSEGMYRILGLQTDQPPPSFEAASRFYAPESAARLAAALERLSAKAVPFDLELQLAPTGSGVRFVRHVGEARSEPGGRLPVLRGSVHDITARIANTSALRRSISHLKITQEITHLGFWHLELPQKHFTFSDEVRHIFGLNSVEKQSWDDLTQAVFPEDRESLAKARNSAVQGAHYDAEYRIVVGGVTKWVREVAKVCALKEGSTSEVIGSVQDITDRIRIQNELMRLNRSLRAYTRSRSELIRATSEQPYLDTICRIIVESAGYRFCWVGKAEREPAGTIRPLAQAGFSDGYLEAVKPTWGDHEWGRGPVGRCIRTGEIQVVRDTATDPNVCDQWRRETVQRGYGSLLAVPIKISGEIFGALCIYAAEPEVFNHEEVILLSELASDLAFGVGALRSASQKQAIMEELKVLNVEMDLRVQQRTREIEEVLHQEAMIGFRVQQMLLFTPPPTNIPGLEIAALSLPSRRIDGDFYDFFHHGEDQLDVVVADVMGKGLQSALVAAAAKSNLLEALFHLSGKRAPGFGALPEPSEVVTLAHAYMSPKLIELETFVTLIYARFDMVRRQLSMVDCGHTGVVLVRSASGECETVMGPNLALGISTDELFDQVVINFEAEDLIVFYSDGFTEARNANRELFGLARFIECIKKNRQLSPEALVQALRSAAKTFTGSDQLYDDQTCVVVRVGAVPPPLIRLAREITSELRSLRSAREFVREFCGLVPTARISESDVAALELAANETVSNIIKHAYHQRADQKILLEAQAYPDRVAIEFHYVGDRFREPEASLPAFDGSRDSGFGLFLVRSSVDQLRHTIDDRGRNQIDLVKLFKP
jgi:sigma-B regulation protein RsbU (phosphoserine phosphatase)